MATGAGKTYTAITSIYRLLKHAGAKRVLFWSTPKTSANKPSRK
jgi:type I site-specific restriction endonuclease